MKILIDGYALSRKEVLGIHRFALELLKAMDKMLVNDYVELAVPAFSNEDLVSERLSFQNIRIVKIGQRKRRSYKHSNIIEEVRWKEITFPRYANKNESIKIDLMLDFPRSKVDIITIHDCIPELYPPANPSLKYRLHVLRLKFLQNRGIKNCKVLLTVSEYSRQDIPKVYHTRGKPICIIPNAWQHFSRITEDEGILEKLNLEKGKYFFSLGSRLHHKNAKWILSAAKKNPQYTFVISGTSFNHADREAEKSDADNVIFAGFLQDSEVKALMHYCKAFIQPSLCEGFGIPPMEAMSVGADCIVSNVTALPEVYKGSVWYIDPYDYEKINLDEIMSRPKESNDLILNEYSWEKSARMLLDIIKELAQQ